MDQTMSIEEFIATLPPRQRQMTQLIRAANAVYEHSWPCNCVECLAFAQRMARDVLADADEDADVSFEIVRRQA